MTQREKDTPQVYCPGQSRHRARTSDREGAGLHLCDKHGLVPTLFYRWQKEMMENMAALFERQAGSETTALKRENEALRQRLADKDRVIAQIMEDFVAVKKTIGGL